MVQNRNQWLWKVHRYFKKNHLLKSEVILWQRFYNSILTVVRFIAVNSWYYSDWFVKKSDSKLRVVIYKGIPSPMRQDNNESFYSPGVYLVLLSRVWFKRKPILHNRTLISNLEHKPSHLNYNMVSTAVRSVVSQPQKNTVCKYECRTPELQSRHSNTFLIVVHPQHWRLSFHKS